MESQATSSDDTAPIFTFTGTEDEFYEAVRLGLSRTWPAGQATPFDHTAAGDTQVLTLTPEDVQNAVCYAAGLVKSGETSEETADTEGDTCRSLMASLFAQLKEAQSSSGSVEHDTDLKHTLDECKAALHRLQEKEAKRASTQVAEGLLMMSGLLATLFSGYMIGVVHTNPPRSV